MSWKGDSIDYGNYSTGGNPSVGGRHQSVYQQDHISGNPGSGLTYEPGSYSSKYIPYFYALLSKKA